MAPDMFIAESAGIEPGKLNPLAVEAMKEKGIDISHKQTRSVFELFKSGAFFQYVITVCDESAWEKCSIFSGAVEFIHWSFPDPSLLTGTHEEKMKEVRKIRDVIEEKIKLFIENVKNGRTNESISLQYKRKA